MPDNGAPDSARDYARRRRAIMAGLATSPTGALGSPGVGRPTLGGSTGAGGTATGSMGGIR